MTKKKSILAMGAAALLLAGCGSSDSESDSQGGDSTNGSQGGAEQAAADAKAFIDEAFEGSWGDVPTEKSEIEPGKKIWIISANENRTSNSIPSAKTAEVAESVGWEADVHDGKSTPAVQSQLVDQAVAAKVDGIVLVSVDCVNVKQSVASAVEAGVVVLGGDSIGCDFPDGGDPVWSYGSRPAGYESHALANAGQGELQAAWVASKLGAEGGKVLLVDVPASVIAHQIQVGAAAGLEKYCPNCEVVDLPIALADINTTLQTKVSTVLSQNPDIKAVIPLFDSVNEGGMTQALLQAGMEDAFVTGSQATPSALKAIAGSGPQDMSVGSASEILGYEYVDELNSLFKGEKPADPVQAWVPIDKDHNLPPNGGQTVVVPFDYEKQYKDRWGL